jgi:hypothetical protein
MLHSLLACYVFYVLAIPQDTVKVTIQGVHINQDSCALNKAWMVVEANQVKDSATIKANFKTIPK